MSKDAAKATRSWPRTACQRARWWIRDCRPVVCSPKSKAVQKYGRAEKRHRPSALLFALLSEACAAELVEGRGDALFDLAARAWYWNETSESSEVRLRMTYSHTIRHGQHTIRKRLQLWNGSGALIQWIHWALQVVVHWS